MAKNPFSKSSRKGKKKRVQQSNLQVPQEKKFCPYDFVRYDNTYVGYNTVWVCKNCFTIILSENQVRVHMKRCKIQMQKQREEKEKEYQKKNSEIPSYICEICDKVFSRKVVYEKHIEEHQPKSDGFESDDLDNETYVPSSKLQASIKQELANDSNANDDDEFENPIAGPSGVKYVPPSAMKKEPLSSDDDDDY